MVITKIQGGLGNQLFQYAFGVHVAKSLNAPLKLDVSWYKTAGTNGETARDFTLNDFFATLPIATKDEIQSITGHQSLRKGHRYAAKLGFNLSKHVLFENLQFAFSNNLSKLKLPLYIEGYWQGCQYLEAFMEREFPQMNLTISPPVDLQTEPTIAIHIRRGDYVGHSTHPIVGLAYYNKAFAKMKLLHEKIGKVLVFSDDITWCINNLQLDANPETIEFVTEGSSIDQFKLMTQCSSFIIGNSTYSWWAAWLGKQPNKTVICPQQWINFQQFNANQFFPPSWIIL